MDRQPPLGAVNDTDAYGDTTLLCAAASLAGHNSSEWTNGSCTYEWYCDRLIRGEKLINILLDRGASASDSSTSSFWNVEGILKALLDHGGSNLVSSLDSEERLPIHWAAAGQGSGIDDIVPENELQTQIVDTFELLLTANPGVINFQDKKGASPIHYAVKAHAACGTGHSYAVIKYLCDNKADTSLVNAEGQMSWLIVVMAADSRGYTVLHIMSRILLQVEAVRFLLSEGADIRATNSNGDGDIPLRGAMRGTFLLPHTATRDEIISETLDHRLKAQDEMIAALQEAPGCNSSLMGQANSDGETPQQLLEETRAKWRETDERLKRGFRPRNKSTQ